MGIPAIFDKTSRIFSFTGRFFVRKMEERLHEMVRKWLRESS